jgi:hypothetical protein
LSVKVGQCLLEHVPVPGVSRSLHLLQDALPREAKPLDLPLAGCLFRAHPGSGALFFF